MREVAAAMEVRGDDGFRIRAYENAAVAVDNLSSEAFDLWEAKKLDEIQGVGANLAQHLDDLFRTGSVKHFTKVKKPLPAGMFALLDISGVGPKIAYTLSKQFGLTKSETAAVKLKKALESGKVADLEGFGEQSQERLLTAVTGFLKKKGPERLLLPVAEKVAEGILSYLSSCPEVIKASALGSLRRRVPTVGDVDIGVATNQAGAVVDFMKQYPAANRLVAAGEGLVRLELTNKLTVDVKLVNPTEWGSLLQHFTGSKNHNIVLRELALKQGKSLSEHGIKHEARSTKQEVRKYDNEEDFYKALGLTWIPPEMRENAGEIEVSEQRKLPQLVELKDIKGDLHTHTDYYWISSHDAGTDDISTLLETAKKLGYDYLALGDHNPSISSYNENKIISLIKERKEYIDKIISTRENKVKYSSIKVLNSLEVDIRPDGTLAIPEEALKYLDFAVVSIHSSFAMKKEEQTKRVLKSLFYAKVKILGHPTGRLINQREELDIDFNAVMAECLKRNIALEINAIPQRLDLPETLVRQAVKLGVKLAINTDAHSADQLEQMRYGVDVARRGWAKKQDIVNAWPWEEFQHWLTG